MTFLILTFIALELQLAFEVLSVVLQRKWAPVKRAHNARRH
jgi:hypothetical protein